MIHMIENKIEAYKVAVERRVRTYVAMNYNLNDSDMTDVNACIEEEQLKLDDLRSTMGMALREYAAREPFSPFNIRSDTKGGE